MTTERELTAIAARDAGAGTTSTILDSFRNVGMSVVGCLFMIVLLIIVPVLVLKGAFWAAEHVLPPLIVAGWIALAVDLIILLPLATVRFLRPWCAGLILLSSFLFGVISWLVGLILTYTLWGLGAVILGLFFLGIGVVPFALLATLFKGMWPEFLTMVALVVVTFGSRFVAFALDDDEPKGSAATGRSSAQASSRDREIYALASQIPCASCGHLGQQHPFTFEKCLAIGGCGCERFVHPEMDEATFAEVVRSQSEELRRENVAQLLARHRREQS